MKNHEYTQTQTFPNAVAVLDNLGEPDQAFKTLQGNTGQATYVTVELLNDMV